MSIIILYYTISNLITLLVTLLTILPIIAGLLIITKMSNCFSLEWVIEVLKDVNDIVFTNYSTILFFMFYYVLLCIFLYFFFTNLYFI
jgi:hypothetical protein